jgi:Asp-tRNA(Asn)/Glu-tRNA(Gln) amidotransferase A subunit family amidase
MSVLADDWRVQEDPVNEPKRIGIVRGIGDIPVSSEVMEAITTAAHVLENLGFEIQELSLPETTDLIELWDRIWAALGGARGLLSGHVSPDQETLLSRQLIRQFEGSPPPDAQALSVAWRTVGEVSTKLQTAISSCVAILSPVAAGPPTERAGQWQIDGRRISGIRGFAYSYVWTLAGCCAMSIPCFRSSVQLVARSGRDESLVDIARRLESASR